MQIQPNTTIKLLSKVPLDNSYRNTIYFATATAQQNFFNSKVRYTLTAQSYQRAGKGKMRISLPYENFYNINYLMFQNSSFNTKWFYAFIVQVEYINNGTTEITYEIDEIQTWLFEMTLKYCFVDREISATDSFPSDCLVPEGIEIGEITNIDEPVTLSYGDNIIGIYSLYDSDGTIQEGEMIENVYSGIHLTEQPATQYENINRFIQSLSSVDVGHLDGIVDIKMYPRACSPNWRGDRTYDGTVNKPTSIGGYVPRNNKLFTYPYCYIEADNWNGTTAIYKWELCDFPSANKLEFHTSAMNVNSPTALTYPKNYNGIETNQEEGIMTSNYPSCAFTGDGFSNAMANSKYKTSLSVLAGAVTTGVGIATASPVGVYAGVQQLMGVGANIGDKTVSPAQLKGNLQADNYNVSRGRNGIIFYNKGITTAMAIVIDDYFSMYGYKTNRVKIPNISARPHWNYTKTVGCNITGDIPVESVKVICDAFDRGITWWKNGNEVGNYSLYNKNI